MRFERILLVVVLGVLCGACTDPEKERPAWVVTVATDARVPQLGDWLLIEVLGDGPLCTDCRRTFGAGVPESWPISFGVLPPTNGATVRVRAVLFRSTQVGSDGLPEGAVIEAVGELPFTEAETRVGLVLSTQCFGVASDLAGRRTCDPATGALGDEPTLRALDDGPLPAPASWPGFAEIACKKPISPEQVCVTGGAFLLGGPSVTLIDELATRPEHVVQLSAFAIDRNEMTVGEVKKWLPLVFDTPVEQSADPKSKLGPCTFLTNDSKNDALPVNCVSHSLAASVCEAQGKRLPTEAEWEYAAGNLGLETNYPWGSDPNICEKALIGRGRLELEIENSVTIEANSCRVGKNGQLFEAGTQPGGAAGDVTLLDVHNLAGNVAEWVEDRFAPYDGVCWDAHGSVLTNPVCDEVDPANATMRPVRGSSWRDSGLLAFAVSRNAALDESPTPGVGFRCVTPE